MSRGNGIQALSVALAVFLSACVGSGDVAERRVRLPESLPADLPLPEGTVLRSSQDFGIKGVNLVFETGEPVAAVLERLRGRLVAAGWVVLSEADFEGSVFVSLGKGARSSALGISRRGDVTVIGMAYQQPAPGQAGDPG